MAELITSYADLGLDAANASIVALTERFNLTTIATLDTRDFQVVKRVGDQGFPGRGIAYVGVFQDFDRAWLKGEESYRLRAPAGVPASLFWSTVCYDNRTRTLIDTDQQGGDRGFQDRQATGQR